ncbi:hypothetical protein SAMN04490205_0065 [Pseudomonas trivialis]|nr:hypothetical protein SAMN04490205_0065 [Pseudomonas trivialis]
MDDGGRKNVQLGTHFRGPTSSFASAEPVGLAASKRHSHAGESCLSGIIFGDEHAEGTVFIPGYNAVAPMIRPARDPALSLVALSGIDPSEPVMVEVPLVLNNTTFTATPLLAGWRIGYVDRYVRGEHTEPAQQSPALCRAFDILRQAGAQWVAVDAQQADDSLHFSLRNRNEIDELMADYRLDAVVSDDRRAAFHGDSPSDYPRVCEVLEDGTQLWFFASRRSRASLSLLVRAFRQGRAA